MSSRTTGAGALRWASGVLVVTASALTLGVPLATSASAASTAGTITATPTHSNYQTGTQASINVTSTGTPTQLEYSIVSGPGTTDGAAATFPSGVDCTSGTHCTFTNGGTAGTDQVRIFDGGTSGTASDFTAGDAFTDVTITFSDAPQTVAVTPPTSSKSVSTCQTFTATATDSHGNPSGQADLTVTATQSVSAGSDTPLAFCSPSGGTSTTNGSAPFTNTATRTVTTGDNGAATFGVESSKAGTVNVKVASATDSTAFGTATLTVTGGQTGNQAVHSITVTPASPSAYAGTDTTYTVTALDTNGDPVSGAQVQYEITGNAADNTAAGVYPNCGAVTAAATGKTTCTIGNNGAGTDSITFFVNQTGGGGGTTGPDAGEPQQVVTATFAPQPAVSTLTLTSPDASNGGAASTDSTIPTSQGSVTFTATAKDAQGHGISGAVVTFTNNSYSPSSPAILPQSQDVTTNASGVATFTVTDSAPANNDTISVSARIGTTAPHPTSTATYATPAPASFTLSPDPQSVAKGGTVNVTATVTNQFGNGVAGQTINYTVTGRNNGKTGTVTTGSNGTATISYTDTGVNAGSNTDTVTATDTSGNAPAGGSKTAEVDYVTSTTASAVTIDVSGLGNGSTCPPASGATKAKTNVALGATTEVCALVKNANGELLSGKTVTFTVNHGSVDAHSGLGASSTGTFPATTNANGIAVADVTSTDSGSQTVTATADATSDTGTITYNAPSAGQATNVALAPGSATVAPGDSQDFTATVTDQFGNVVPGVAVTFSKGTGPGNFGAVSSVTATTDASGTATATLSTSDSDTGSGTVTASIESGATNCGSAQAGNCTTSSAYTVEAPPAPSSITLTRQTGKHVGQREHVSATVTNDDGSAAAGVVVRFTVHGANATSGAATTGAGGTASFSYKAGRAGKDTITAFADANDDGARQAGEPVASVKAKITKVTEKPTVTLKSKKKGHLTIKAVTNPALSHETIHFYAVSKSGHRSLLGSKDTRKSGHATKTFKLTSGTKYKIQVRVVHDSSIVSKFSHVESKKVK